MRGSCEGFDLCFERVNGEADETGILSFISLRIKEINHATHTNGVEISHAHFFGVFLSVAMRSVSTCVSKYRQSR